MGELQQVLRCRGIYDEISLLLMTLEPEIDTPEMIRDYALNRGVVVDARVQLLTASTQEFPELIEELSVPVSYTENAVAVHDVVLYLFDGEGRVARTYSLVFTDPTSVVEDLVRLVAESRAI